MFEDETEVKSYFSLSSTWKRCLLPCIIISATGFSIYFIGAGISRSVFAVFFDRDTFEFFETIAPYIFINGIVFGLLLSIYWAPLYWLIFLRRRLPHELQALSERIEDRRIATETLDLVQNLMSEQRRQFERFDHLGDLVVRFGKDSLYLEK